MNIVGILVLLKHRSASLNIFNDLIIILFVVDSLFLCTVITYSLQKSINLQIRTLTLLVPKVAYPMQHMTITSSIFMTLGITHERYVAIKYPLIHRQRMISAKYRRISLMKYITVALFCAFAFNIPTFFEVRLEDSTDDIYRYTLKER